MHGAHQQRQGHLHASDAAAEKCSAMKRMVRVAHAQDLSEPLPEDLVHGDLRMREWGVTWAHSWSSERHSSRLPF